MSALQDLLHHEAHAYTGGDDRPLAAYTGTMAVYAGTVAAAVTAARATRRPLPAPGPWDLAVNALATHQLARLIAKDPVTSPLRAPFTRFQGASGPAELDEDVRGSGVRKAVGELVTCPFCTGLWVATAITVGSLFAPRATRLATSTLAALAGADFLHFARVTAQHAADGPS
ncbi:DUF1360 domain-containing protein [Kitasatospora terrestris]|uniref:DUF1360 domain-containing protein n=1 Tax=Kitasatospora terrestris TaxID=258051 RepID=A0ABP9EMS2_9ACTN